MNPNKATLFEIREDKRLGWVVDTGGILLMCNTYKEAKRAVKNWHGDHVWP